MVWLRVSDFWALESELGFRVQELAFRGVRFRVRGFQSTSQELDVKVAGFSIVTRNFM